MGCRHRKIYTIGAGDALYVISAPTEVVQYHTEWPELIVGDETTDRTIQALESMQTRMMAADKFAAKYIAASAQRRFQIERDGMINSAGELVCVLDGLSGHFGGGKMPWSITQQMEQLLDDLTYYLIFAQRQGISIP